MQMGSGAGEYIARRERGKRRKERWDKYVKPYDPLFHIFGEEYYNDAWIAMTFIIIVLLMFTHELQQEKKEKMKRSRSSRR